MPFLHIYILYCAPHIKFKVMSILVISRAGNNGKCLLLNRQHKSFTTIGIKLISNIFCMPYRSSLIRKYAAGATVAVIHFIKFSAAPFYLPALLDTLSKSVTYACGIKSKHMQT